MRLEPHAGALQFPRQFDKVEDFAVLHHGNAAIGAWTGRDLLREEFFLERLEPQLEGIDELIFLGDLYDFLFGSLVFQIALWGVIGGAAAVASFAFYNRYRTADQADAQPKSVEPQ